MSDNPDSRETRRATGAVARLLRDEFGADPDVLAAEIVSLLRARRWRHLDSLSPLPDDLRAPPKPPSDGYRDARRRLTRRPTP